LVAQERVLTARLLMHLGEVDARGLFREQAFASMFEYAVEVLRMSPDEAYVRIRAAKVGREFPLVLEMLERNELHLSAIKLLGPLLTASNHVEVLGRARGKSKRAVEEIVAELAPKPDAPNVLRKLPASSATPLSPGRYKVQFTATRSLYEKLRQAQEIMRHKVPDGDLGVIVERAVDLLIEQQMKQRFAQTKGRASRIRRSKEGPSRYVPRAVVREVVARDGLQCTFVSPEGRRCASLGFLELHHEIPHARSGLPTPENMKILCRAHNALMAERDFGRWFMREFSPGP
jgi:hypothetical protein